jgi:hypothetical protein
VQPLYSAKLKDIAAYFIAAHLEALGFMACRRD